MIVIGQRCLSRLLALIILSIFLAGTASYGQNQKSRPPNSKSQLPDSIAGYSKMPSIFTRTLNRVEYSRFKPISLANNLSFSFQHDRWYNEANSLSGIRPVTPMNISVNMKLSQGRPVFLQLQFIDNWTAGKNQQFLIYNNGYPYGPFDLRRDGFNNRHLYKISTGWRF